MKVSGLGASGPILLGPSGLFLEFCGVGAYWVSISTVPKMIYNWGSIFNEGNLEAYPKSITSLALRVSRFRGLASQTQQAEKMVVVVNKP